MLSMLRRFLHHSQLPLLIFLAIAACGKQKSEVPVTTTGTDSKPDGNHNSQKPQFDVPPLYSESQFKIGQWIEWKNSTAGSKDCLQWKIANITTTGILIEARTSRKCETPDNSRVESIFFAPDSGDVLSDQIKTEGVPVPDVGPLKGLKIFSFLYGSSEKVQFTNGTWKLNDENQLSSYNVLSMKDRLFYNNPGHPFHAFALKFKDEKSGAIYRYKQSEPELEYLPKDP